MRRITLSVDDEVLKKARKVANEKKTTVLGVGGHSSGARAPLEAT
jgi:hypothetical protein